MAQLSNFQSDKPLSGIPADHKPVSRPTEFVTEVFSAASYCNHGKILHVKQARMDMVGLK